MAQSVTNHIQQVLECPVCLETPRAPPIYQCERGHMLCSICRAKLYFCPICQFILGNSRCLIAEKVLEG